MQKLTCKKFASVLEWGVLNVDLFYNGHDVDKSDGKKMEAIFLFFF